MKFPICVASDGTVTNPDKLAYDPYKLPWVTGAAATLTSRQLAKYPEGRKDLNEKLAVLKSKRSQKDGGQSIHTVQRRSAAFKALTARPLPADGNPFGTEA